MTSCYSLSFFSSFFIVFLCIFFILLWLRGRRRGYKIDFSYL